MPNKWQVVHTSEEGVVTIAPDYRDEEHMLNLTASNRVKSVFITLNIEARIFGQSLDFAAARTDSHLLTSPATH